MSESQISFYPHTDAKKSYRDGAKNKCRHWEEWQVATHIDRVWQTCARRPKWRRDLIYRLKPKEAIMEDRLIAIRCARMKSVNWGSSVRDAVEDRLVRFDEQEAFLYACDIDAGSSLLVCVHNPKLPRVPERECVPVFSIDEAKVKFPFLFKPRGE